MKLENVNGHLAELPENLRPAVAGLIDTVVEANMNQVLEKLNAIDLRFDSMQKQLDTLKWTVLISMGVISLIVTMMGIALGIVMHTVA